MPGASQTRRTTPPRLAIHSLGAKCFATIAFVSAPPVTAPAATDAVAQVLEAFGAVLIAQRRLRGRDAREHAELSYAQARLLSALEDHAGSPASVIAERAGITPGSVTPMLDHLERMGFVTRRRSETDRRVMLTALTDAGRRTRDTKLDAARQAFAAALAGLAPEELSAAPRVLRVIAHVIESL